MDKDEPKVEKQKPFATFNKPDEDASIEATITTGALFEDDNSKEPDSAELE